MFTQEYAHTDIQREGRVSRGEEPRALAKVLDKYKVYKVFLVTIIRWLTWRQ